MLAPVTEGMNQAKLLSAVQTLRHAVAATTLPLDVPRAPESRRERDELLKQLDDYIIPRVSSLDAPLLAVVGGSTGAGKSTLVNSIVGETVTKSGVLRPTTRASSLIHNPADASWFEGTRMLPGLARLTGDSADNADPASLRLVSSDTVPLGLALLDAPDIDSVVAANRDLSRQLLSAADLWLFVTTAVRYADAVPWDLLHQAIDRGTSVAIVLDRVPMDVMEEVRADLAGMLMHQGLGQSPVFAVAESTLTTTGLLPDGEVARIRGWLRSLASDAHARNIVIKRTLDGALDSLHDRTTALQVASTAQRDGFAALDGEVESAYVLAIDGVKEGMADGSLLRGEVLARWQEFVGTGEVLRQLEAGVGRLRDKVTSFLQGRGRTQPAGDLGQALQTGVAALLQSCAESASLKIARNWRSTPGGASVIETHQDLGHVSSDFEERSTRLVREWQDDVLQMVRDEAGDRRTTARFLAFGVNGISVMLMLIVFSTTGGVTGAEVGIAGGSAVLAQRLLEAIFGDQAVRTLSTKARARLLERTETLYADERSRYTNALQVVVGDAPNSSALEAAIKNVKAAR